MNYSHLIQWCIKLQERKRERRGDVVITAGKPPPPAAWSAIYTPPAPERRDRRRRRSRSGCLHYSAATGAALQRWRWWNLSIHQVAESELLMLEQFVSVTDVLFFSGRDFCFHDKSSWFPAIPSQCALLLWACIDRPGCHMASQHLF